MTYKELHKLIDEFGLQVEGNRLSFKNYTVAHIENFNENISLDFISSSFTKKYDVAKKAAAKRIAIIKDIMVAIK